MSKIFSEEIKRVYNKLLSSEKFTVVRYGDGEWMAMNGHSGESGNGEWTIGVPNNQNYEISKQKLWDAFKHQDQNYFLGIPCPCCQGNKFNEIKEASGQPIDNLTFANIFVNSNYTFFISNIIPFLKKQNNIHLIANKVTDIEKLPFSVEKFYPINYNAWITDLSIIEAIKDKEYKDKIFLFSGGSFSKIACYELWKANKNNIYLDIGSTIDPWTKANRLLGKYYTPGSPYINKTCHWG